MEKITKETIENARTLLLHIRDLQDELNHFDGVYAQSYTGVAGANDSLDRIGGVVEKRELLRKRIEESLAEHYQKQIDIFEWLSDIKDPIIREMVFLRAIKGISWEAISIKLDPDALSDSCTPDALKQRWNRFWRNR